MRTFDFYEFAGLIAPGGLVLFSIALLYPRLQAELAGKDLTLGGLGLFVILAYVAGHLVQAVGNVVELLWWTAWGGMPTDWVRTGRRHVISDIQIKALKAQLPSKLGIESPLYPHGGTKVAWSATSRQIYAAVAAHGRAARIDVFNGNYGLNRGIAAALLVVCGFVLIHDPARWRVGVGLLAMAGIALYRMHRFGKHYARELLVQFLQLPGCGGSK